jgi:hypothetical protein
VFESVEARLTAAAAGTTTTSPVVDASWPARAPVELSAPRAYGAYKAPLEVALPRPWWSDLAVAQHPRQIVAGDPDATDTLGADLCRFATNAADAVGCLRRMSTGARAGVTADALRHAQAIATQAIERWAQAVAAARAAPLSQDPPGITIGHPGVPNGLLSATDGTVAVLRDEAAGLVRAARSEADAATGSVVRALRRAADPAPDKPGFWSHAGGALGGLVDRASDAASTTLRVLEAVGYAAIDHPEDLLLAAAGMAVIAASVGGAAGGTVLSTTGVGAVAGAPVAAQSLLGVAAGAGIVLAAGDDFARRSTERFVEKAGRREGDSPDPVVSTASRRNSCRGPRSGGSTSTSEQTTSSTSSTKTGRRGNRVCPMTPKAVIQADLTIESTSFDPDEITARLGVEPTTSLRMGERMRPQSPPSQWHRWKLDLGSAPIAAYMDEELLSPRLGELGEPVAAALNPTGSACRIRSSPGWRAPAPT